MPDRVIIRVMNQAPPLWVTLVTPVATLLGTMLIVMVGVFLQNRAIESVRNELRAEMQALRAEFKQGLAELKVEVLTRIGDVEHRIERLEEQRGLIRER